MTTVHLFEYDAQHIGMLVYWPDTAVYKHPSDAASLFAAVAGLTAAFPDHKFRVADRDAAVWGQITARRQHVVLPFSTYSVDR